VSIKKNIVASYVSQIYVTLVGILALPFYIKYMGAEAYGLVGFFTMLQTWFALLDLGLTPTIARETARFRAGSYDNLSYRRLFRALSVIFLGIALMGGGLLFLLSDYLSTHWLKINKLDLNEVQFAIQIMAISVALRWMTGLYRGVVTGSERLVWLSGFNSGIASLRFLGIFPVIWYFGATPTVFFQYQLLIALVEFFGLWFKSRQLLPKLDIAQEKIVGWSIKPIKSVLGFSLSIALTGGIWVFVTQTDKLIMSNLLSLENYGYFTLAVLVAGGIMMISAPISGALTPRMVKLDAESNQEELIQLYRKSTQLVTVLAGSVAIILATFSKPLLYLWTGDQHIANVAAETLTLYAIGYGFLAVSAFPFYLQYAKGKLKLHIVGSLLYITTLLPLLFILTHNFGMQGAGYTWLIVNILYFFTWTGYVHHIYLKGIHFSWLIKDVIQPIIISIIVAILLSKPIRTDVNQLELLIILVISTTIVITISVLSSSYLRSILFSIFNSKYAKYKTT